LTAVSGTNSGDQDYWSIDVVPGKILSLPRFSVINTGNTLPASKSLHLSYFTANQNLSATSVVTNAGTTAATSATLSRIGIYSVDGSENLTLIGSIVDDHSNLWTSTFTVYTRSLSATTTITKGSRYAIGLLCVTTGALPSFPGTGNVGGNVHPFTPRLSGVVTNQNDLPSTVTAGSVTAAGFSFMHWLT
jgi:hypothetical protein